MKNLIVLILMLTVTTLYSQSKEQKQFVQKYGHLADFLEYMYDVPKEITLGVAALESNYGLSKAATERNNFFGILNGSKEFDSPEASFIYFGRLLSGNTGNEYLTKRYKPLKNRLHWREWAIMLGTNVDLGGVGYAVDNPQYAGKVIRVVLSLDELIQ